MHRRDFLKVTGAALGYAAFDATVPAWVARSAQAMSGCLPPDRILVIVQMAGGNDGLNTVIPIEDDLYNGDSLRPKLRIRNGFHPLGDGLNALHPRMADLQRWYLDGYMAVVQNVGYPNPNLSHFVSTDYWERGASPGSETSPVGQGWVSRFFDNACAGTPAEQLDPLGMVASYTSGLPDAMGGSDRFIPPRVGDFSKFAIKARTALRGQYLTELNRLAVSDANLAFIQRVETATESAIEQIAIADTIPELRMYPEDKLGQGLGNISKLIRSGQGTNIYFVTQGGFDTHNGQVAVNDPAGGDHGELLGGFNNALHAFLSDMQDSGYLDRVLVLTFSEFGRRAGQNGSLGTDHGTSNCLFLMGGGARGGVYGGQPDLANLDDNNLRHRIDFRAVYTRVIQDWFQVDATPTFGNDLANPAFAIQDSLDCLAPLINTTGALEPPAYHDCMPIRTRGCFGRMS